MLSNITQSINQLRILIKGDKKQGNSLLSTSGGASWVSVHNGGGVGIGLSIHAGLVIVADGTSQMQKRINRVLTNDPGIGVARHLDAGYKKAIQIAHERNLKIPK